MNKQIKILLRQKTKVLNEKKKKRLEKAPICTVTA